MILREGLSEGKTPGTVPAGLGRIRRASNAFGPDARVDGFCKAAIFDDTPGLIGVMFQSFRLVSGLDAVLDHLENKRICFFFHNLLLVDTCIKTELEGCFERLQPPLGPVSPTRF